MEGMREVFRKGNTDRLMVETRALGCIPKDDHGVAQRFRKAMRYSVFSEEQLAELAEIGRANIQPLAEETEPPDPRDAFSEEASSRLEQDILLAKKFGVRFRKSKLSQRVERYKKYMTQLGAEELDVVKQYKDLSLIHISEPTRPY